MCGGREFEGLAVRGVRRRSVINVDLVGAYFSRVASVQSLKVALHALVELPGDVNGEHVVLARLRIWAILACGLALDIPSSTSVGH